MSYMSSRMSVTILHEVICKLLDRKSIANRYRYFFLVYLV